MATPAGGKEQQSEWPVLFIISSLSAFHSRQLFANKVLSPPLVDLTQLSAQQLAQVKKQLDDEVQHLTNSYQNLRAAQQKFRDCVASIREGVEGSVQGT